MSRVHDLLVELGISIDPQLFELALTHRSFAYENGALPHNERLEFLGDAVLGLVVTDHLYRTYPAHPEGRLAKLRAAVVNAGALADVSRQLELGPLIRLGKGELGTGGADKSSILADVFEAFLGALYLSAGRDAAERLVHNLFDDLITQADGLGAGLDWKTSLQELCAIRELGVPGYAISESGPDHDKRFAAEAVIGELRFPAASGTSKKQAEQGAAQAAFQALFDA
jgi:ribonuclease-3